MGTSHHTIRILFFDLFGKDNCSDGKYNNGPGGVDCLITFEDGYSVHANYIPQGVEGQPTQPYTIHIDSVNPYRLLDINFQNDQVYSVDDDRGNVGPTTIAGGNLCEFDGYELPSVDYIFKISDLRTESPTVSAFPSH